MELTSQVACVDWGTSNFRLYVINSRSGEIIYNHFSDHGVRSFQSSSDPIHAQKKYLSEHIAASPLAKSEMIIISGMASSSIGIKELEYAAFPLSATSPKLVIEQLSIIDNHPTFLISGVSDGMSFMRGEEIQALGTILMIKKCPASFILVLPGTHSKHLSYSDGAFRSMSNFMTGELHSVLSRHSILSSAVTSSEWSPDIIEAYKKGLIRITQSNHGLSGELLTLRAHELTNRLSQSQGSFYLSGLLIGAELDYLRHGDDQIYINTSGVLYQLYKYAVEVLDISERTTFLTENILTQALFKGQLKAISLI